MKKQNKKNRKNNYNGRNIFGERCVAKTLKLEKETAFEQCVQMLKEVMTSEVRIEYAARRKILQEHEARKAAKRAEAEANEIPEVKIVSEVKIR